MFIHDYFYNVPLLLDFLCRYKMVHFILTKQILYVLHTQLVSLPENWKRSYGITNVTYSINGTSLSFKFWKEGRKRPIEGSQTTNPDFVMIRLQERDGLMAIVGECNGRSFEVDLRKYRIVGVIQNVLLDKRYHD